MSIELADPVNALTFQSDNSMRAIEASIHDPFIRALFQGALNTRVLNHQLCALDIEQTTEGTFSVKKEIAIAIWQDVIKIAQIIHCAANDFSPFDQASFSGARLLPLTIPEHALESISLPAPIISISLVRPKANPLLVTFDNLESVKQRVEFVQSMANTYLAWLGVALGRSLQQGLRSQWNFGSYWGISHGEFLYRVGGDAERVQAVSETIFNSYDFTSIEASMSLLILDSDKELKRSILRQLRRSTSHGFQIRLSNSQSRRRRSQGRNSHRVA